LTVERRQDDTKMFMLRLLSAASLIFLVFQLAKDPENLDSLSKITGESVDDLFNWGHDRFIVGKLGDSSGNSTHKRKKTPQEIFMEAILEEEEAPKVEETTAEPQEETNVFDDSHPDYATDDIPKVHADDEDTAEKAEKAGDL
jgi:hypothetical protein